MADKILTLCDKCAEEMQIGGFEVKPVTGRQTTEKKDACENCGQRTALIGKQYIVSAKRS